MKREQIIEQGMRLLSDVHDDEHFKTVDGQTLRSVRELVLLLETYHDEHFRHHVNEHRNDFAAWIEHSVGDPTLAERIRNASTPVRIQQEIAARLEEIENNLLSFEKEPVEEPLIEKPHHEPRSPKKERRSEDERSEEEQPEADKVERDELLEEIERSIAQARAQLEIERAQEMREPEDLSGEPEDFEESDEDEKKPITKPQGKTKREKKEKSAKATKNEDTSSEFSLKDFFIGFAFGALIGGVLGAIIGLMFL